MIPHLPTLPKAEGFIAHLESNMPCLITEVAESWEIPGFNPTPEGGVDFEKLKELYGEAFVSVETPGDESAPHSYGMAPRYKCAAKEYFDWAMDPCRQGVRYLKDWHFISDFGIDLPIPPTLGKDPDFDWLNMTVYFEEKQLGDFQFCYVGVQGSSTTLHVDVLCSYSWSVNMVGVKKWVLFSPDLFDHVIDKKGMAITLAEAEANSWLWDQRLEIIQQPREILFVPSQWAHCVYNETDCISLNRNWFCGPTWPSVWSFLLSELSNVEKELDDIRDAEDWDDICQNVLLANSNMNIRMWEEMLDMVPGKSAWAQAMVAEARKAFHEWKTALVSSK